VATDLRQTLVSLGCAGLLALAATGPAVAQGQTPAARSAAAAFVFSAQETQNAIVKAMDDDLLTQRRRAETLGTQLASVRTQLTAAQAGAGAAQSRAVALQAQIDQLSRDVAEAQDQFTTALAQKDETYARQMNNLRGAADTFLANSDGVRLLNLYNAGDYEGFMAMAGPLLAVRDKDRDLQSAADRRAIAVVSLDAVSKGKAKIAPVIDIFVEVTRLDPGHFEDWMALAGLYRGVNDLSKAGDAAAKAGQIATEDAERVEARTAIGDIDSDRGDQVAALAAYRGALDTANRLAAQDTASLDLKRLRIAALGNVAQALQIHGALAAASTTYRDAATASLAILGSGHASLLDEQQAVELQVAMGHLLIAGGQAATVAPIAQGAVDLSRDFLKTRPDDLTLQQDLAAALDLLGIGLAEQKDVAGARTAYEGAFTIYQALFTKDPTFTGAEVSMSVELERLGRLQAEQGDLDDALAKFQLVLSLRRILAKADPTSAEHRLAIVLLDEEIGPVTQAMGDSAAAMAADLEAVTLGHALVAADPTSLADREALAAAVRQTAELKVLQDKKDIP
jgi:tetratricopeptide (TPR) repeat protein